MKILHVFDHSLPLHSGYSFRSMALMREQQARGWDPVAVTTPKHTAPGPEVEELNGVRFYRTAIRPAAAARIPVLREAALIRATARRIVEVARRERPDMLHAHSPVLNALACLSAARELKIPVVYEVRAFWEDAAVDLGTTAEGSLRYRVTRALETHALRRADGVAAICRGLRDDMVARGIPAEKVTLIPNGVDVVAFPIQKGRDAALERELNLAGRTVLGFIGSFYAYEGLDLLIRSLPDVLAARPDMRVLLVGGGPTEAALKAQVHAAGLEDKVIFTGRVPHDQVARYYSLVDLFVYPRHPMRLTETVTPLKPLEAMARGALVLASDVGGHRELVIHGRTGFLFRAGDADALAQSIRDVLGGAEDWPRMRAAARAFVESERTWSRSADNYVRLYGSVLGEQPPAPHAACPPAAA